MKSLTVSVAKLLTLLMVLRFTGAHVVAQGIPEPSLIVYGDVRNGNVRMIVGTLTWRFQADSRFVLVQTAVTNNININDQFKNEARGSSTDLLRSRSSTGLEPRPNRSIDHDWLTPSDPAGEAFVFHT